MTSVVMAFVGERRENDSGSPSIIRIAWYYLFLCVGAKNHSRDSNTMGQPKHVTVIIATILLGQAVGVECISLLGGGGGRPSGATTASLPKVGQVTAGPLKISQLGCGTWSWGNRLLWDYDPSQDEDIYEAGIDYSDAVQDLTFKLIEDH